ncbi:short-subunit dehydrogenase [Crenobacter luteus]|uniref:SDR family NAD(P)-dependent oxidoreductase n=1 Tax=Crenobacter luteus TaxID=1452487 RepID=UPI00105357D6|nr:SDR family NAD(P)-dependent oxidoreductase [Crenobacter luteus]TCP14553.1 short-subunit dehydrogenase [Crenobacter luteus]
MQFHDRTVLITGAAGNLGRAVADAFYAQGANLVLLGQHAEHLTEAFGAEDARRQFAAVDLLDADAVARAADAARARFGRVDVLCNLAGGFRMGTPVHATADADLDFLFDINVRTMMHAVRAVAPGMVAAGGGKIVNVGANAAGKGVAQMGAYCAAKSALIRLTEAMAAELREAGVNVNCVLPTIIDTPENRAAMPGADPARWVAPAALADVIAFLASDAARAIHGAAVPVTGLS